MSENGAKRVVTGGSTTATCFSTLFLAPRQLGIQGHKSHPLWPLWPHPPS